MIELAAWCGLRLGEVAELRRTDMELKEGVTRVSRAVQCVEGQKIVAAPKADSVRVVAFPPHLGEQIKERLRVRAQWGKDGCSSRRSTAGSTGPHLSPRVLQECHGGRWTPRPPVPRPPPRRNDRGGSVGRDAGGVDERLRPSTVSAALVCQRAAQGHNGRIAARLSRTASSGAQPCTGLQKLDD